MSDWESACNLGVNGGRSRKLRRVGRPRGRLVGRSLEDVHNPVLFMQPRTE
jgi:hypothetical protein